MLAEVWGGLVIVLAFNLIAFPMHYDVKMHGQEFGIVGLFLTHLEASWTGF